MHGIKSHWHVMLKSNLSDFLCSSEHRELFVQKGCRLSGLQTYTVQVHQIYWSIIDLFDLEIKLCFSLCWDAIKQVFRLRSQEREEVVFCTYEFLRGFGVHPHSLLAEQSSHSLYWLKAFSQFEGQEHGLMQEKEFFLKDDQLCVP